jgi:5-formyltetrahydrofolate cyclo-ligase
MSDPGRVASPPCLACEQVRDVTRWRKAERARLLADRQALSASQRRSAADTIAANLDTLLDAHFPNFDGLTISAWWPIKAELNLRLWLESLLARGARVALPMVVAPAAPLAFRLWTCRAFGRSRSRLTGQRWCPT